LRAKMTLGSRTRSDLLIAALPAEKQTQSPEIEITGHGGKISKNRAMPAGGRQLSAAASLQGSVQM